MTQHLNMDSCPVCKLSRYKDTGVINRFISELNDISFTESSKERITSALLAYYKNILPLNNNVPSPNLPKLTEDHIIHHWESCASSTKRKLFRHYTSMQNSLSYISSEFENSKSEEDPQDRSLLQSRIVATEQKRIENMMKVMKMFGHKCLE